VVRVTADRFAAIPSELRERPQWVLWVYEERDGKLTKAPYQARNPKRRASSTDAETWATFEEAIAAVGQGDGIGFVFSAEDPYFGVDLDGELDADERGVILAALDTYSETSISKNGYHAIGHGKLPEGSRNRRGPIEVYDSGRFFVVTGDHVRGTPETIEARQAELETVLEQFLPAPKGPSFGSLEPQPVDLDDRELIDRALRAKNGALFGRLMAGDANGFPSASEADLAFCGLLAFWTGRDPERIDRIFRSSGLMREKWERDDYRGGTIEKAIADCPDVFRPRPATSSRPRPETAPVDPSTSSLLQPLMGPRDEVETTSSPDLVPEAHSWRVIDIVARSARPPEPPEIVGLFYVGLFHLLSGESESLKTWLALLAAVEELRAGRGVLWVDGDDVGAGALLERLRALGADDESITERFAYILPDEELDGDKRADVLAVARQHACRLAVFDGFNPLLQIQGLDPNIGVEVERFYRLIDPIRKLGIATVLTDNVVKSRGDRGAWAIGSERKRSKADVHLGMKTLEPLVRGGQGRAKIDIHKDRPGHLERPSPGVFVLDNSSTGMTWRIEPDESRGAEGEFRPTHLMEKVSRQLEVHSEPQSRNQIESAKLGKTAYVRVAIDRLVEEGYATEFSGSRGARLVRLDRAFRDDNEAGEP
jgi:hypothetical protein